MEHLVRHLGINFLIHFVSLSRFSFPLFDLFSHMPAHHLHYDHSYLPLILPSFIPGSSSANSSRHRPVFTYRNDFTNSLTS